MKITSEIKLLYKCLINRKIVRFKKEFDEYFTLTVTSRGIGNNFSSISISGKKLYSIDTYKKSEYLFLSNDNNDIKTSHGEK